MALEAAELRERLQQLRAPLSVRAAAEKAGVTERTWTRWENGDSKPMPENVEAICEAFDVDPAYITGSPEYVGPLARLEAKLDQALENQAVILGLLGRDDLAEEMARPLEELQDASRTGNGTTPPKSSQGPHAAAS